MVFTFQWGPCSRLGLTFWPPWGLDLVDLAFSYCMATAWLRMVLLAWVWVWQDAVAACW